MRQNTHISVLNFDVCSVFVVVVITNIEVMRLRSANISHMHIAEIAFSTRSRKYGSRDFKVQYMKSIRPSKSDSSEEYLRTPNQ